MEFLLLVGIVVIVVMNIKMSARVTDLERQINQLRNTGRQGESVQNAETTPFHTSDSPVSHMYQNGEVYTRPVGMMPQSVSPYENTTAAPNAGSQFFEWLQKDLLMKFGALFLLMGCGWFVSYAFIHEWIGEAGRITIGILFGAMVLILGAWRIKTREHQGAIFTVLGATIVLLTVFAARAQYGMFDKYSALALMFLTVLFVAFVSLKFRRNSLALASLILATLAPYLTASPASNLNDHFIYMLIVVLGTLWVVYTTGWRNLTFTALLLTFFTSMPYGAMGSEKMIALLWVFIFTAIFFVANIVSLIRQSGGITSKTNLYTALGTAVFLVSWIFSVAPEESRSLLLVAWMIVFSVGAYLVFRSTNIRGPFYVYGGTSIALLAAATTAEVQGAVLTIALTFEVAVLVIVAQTLSMGSSVVRSLSFLFIGPILLSLGSVVSSSWRSGVIHEDFFTLLVMMLTLAIVGLLLHEKHKAQHADAKGSGGSLITLGALYGLTLIWLIFHALFINDIATMFALVVYTVIGIVIYYQGKVSGSHALRVGGGALLGFVVCRLLFVDVWNMDLAGRIITFFAIGILLLSTAFLGRSHTSSNQELQK